MIISHEIRLMESLVEESDIWELLAAQRVNHHGHPRSKGALHQNDIAGTGEGGSLLGERRGPRLVGPGKEQQRALRPTKRQRLARIFLRDHALSPGLFAYRATPSWRQLSA